MNNDRSLADMTVRELLNAFADSEPTPGGGSAAALAGAVSASLTAMVANLTAKKKGFEGVAASMSTLASEAEALVGQLANAIDKDAEAYDAVTSAFKLLSSNDEEKTVRRRAIQSAMKLAAETPLQVAEESAQGAALARRVLIDGNPNASTDAAVAILFAAIAIEGACLNVAMNLDSIKDQAFIDDHKQRIATLLDQARQDRQKMWKILADRIKSLPGYSS